VEKPPKRLYISAVFLPCEKEVHPKNKKGFASKRGPKKPRGKEGVGTPNGLFPRGVQNKKVFPPRLKNCPGKNLEGTNTQIFPGVINLLEFSSQPNPQSTEECYLLNWKGILGLQT